MPSVRIRIRSPWKPRSTGREALGPNEVADTPGWCARVSPIVGLRSRASSTPLTTDRSGKHLLGEPAIAQAVLREAEEVVAIGAVELPYQRLVHPTW